MARESILLANSGIAIPSIDNGNCETDVLSKGVHLNSITGEILSMTKCFQLIETSTFDASIDNNHNNYNRKIYDTTYILTKLHSEAEHWLPPDNYPMNNSVSSFWLQSWLSGKTPPLRCNAYTDNHPKNDNNDNKNRCLNHTNIIDGYCIKSHKCLSKNHNNCEFKRLSSVVKFCDLHRCKNDLFSSNSPECKNEKLHNSDFCDSHSCPGCIQLGAVYIGMFIII